MTRLTSPRGARVTHTTVVVDPLVGQLLDAVRVWYAADIAIEQDGFHQLRRSFYKILGTRPPDPIADPAGDKASWGEVTFARDGVADE